MLQQALWPILTSAQDQPQGSFLQRLFDYLANRDEIFSETIAQFFKGLFQMFGVALLRLLVPHLNKLYQLAGTGKPEEVHAMSTAAEVTSALVRGMKHWSYDDVQEAVRILSFVNHLCRTPSCLIIGNAYYLVAPSVAYQNGPRQLNLPFVTRIHVAATPCDNSFTSSL